MKKKLIILLLTFCCTFPVFGMEIADVGDHNQLQLEAHINRNGRVVVVLFIMVSALAAWTGYNTYKARQLANELESKEAELEEKQKELQASQLALASKDAQLEAKQRELYESQVALAEQQQQLKEVQTQLSAKQEQQSTLLGELGDVREHQDVLKVHHAFVAAMFEEIRAQNAEKADLNDRVRVLEKARVREFADEVYDKCKERTKYALVEVDN
jgi:cell division protein FtsL